MHPTGMQASDELKILQCHVEEGQTVRPTWLPNLLVTVEAQLLLLPE